MMSVNSRSVLRPEYLGHAQLNTSGDDSGPNPLDRRYNTNTAPVYVSDNSFAIRRRPFRRIHHPYVVSDYKTSRVRLTGSKCKSNGVSQDQPNVHVDTTKMPLCYDSSPRSDANSASPTYSYGSRFPVDSISTTRHPRKDSPPPRKEEYGNSRSYTHGQAEQIRRSRESTTFALIDAQLAIPPLNLVRDMYLQTRSGSTNNSSAARTTKKVNLSVVHTVVRFRIKDYLRDVQEHLRRLLDSLFHNMYDNYDPRMRNALASQLFGISRAPCSPDCQYCPELQLNGKNSNHSSIRNESRHRMQTTRVSPFPHFSRPYSTSSSSLNTPILSASDGPSDAHDYSPSDPSPETVECEVLPNVDHWLASTDIDLPEQMAISEEAEASTAVDLISGNDSVLEKPLLSYHMNSELFESKDDHHARLDSNSLRLVNEFDTADWSVENIDLGPFNGEPVDLHTLVVDPTVDPLGIKVDESFFDPAYDPNDLIPQLGIDKCPSLPSSSP